MTMSGRGRRRWGHVVRGHQHADRAFCPERLDSFADLRLAVLPQADLAEG
jgi:hypothetical protein